MYTSTFAFAAVIGILACGTTASDLTVYRPWGDDEPAYPSVLKGKPREAKPEDDEVRKLMIARYNAALLEAQKRIDADGEFAMKFAGGATDQCVTRLFEAELALAERPQDRVKAASHYLEVAKFMEGYMEILVKAGTRPKDAAGVETCKYLRADAEVRLAQAKRQAGAK
jgi:hypothetical protein